jgi:hypothetical protein
MNLPDENRLNFVIYLFTSFAESMTGGLVALHKLAFKLAERGNNVFMFCEPEFPHPNIKKIKSKKQYDIEFIQGHTWEQFSFPLEKTISIYPQINSNNPFNTKYVTRWILYDTQEDIESTYNTNDEYFFFGDFKTFRNVEYKQLTVFSYFFDKLYKFNHGKRKTFCHIIHKNTPLGGEEIFEKLGSFDLTNWKTSGGHEYLRDRLNEYEYMLTYDQKTFYSLAAGLCGTKTIILCAGSPYVFTNNAYTESEDYKYNMSPTEYRIRNPIQAFGVAYGWDDITWANKTIGFVSDYLKELEKIDDKTVDRFVNFWNKKLNIT